MYARGHVRTTRRQHHTQSAWYASVEAKTLAHLDATWSETTMPSHKETRMAPEQTPAMITYRGATMIASWPAQIRQAQTEQTTTLDGVLYARIPFGKEPWFAHLAPTPAHACRDCGVLPGEFHVTSCCLECCPACGDVQRLLCPTGHEGALV